MKPILYDYTEKKFTTNGIGTLADAISCTVIEERNGSYELEMEYPLGGINYDEIRNNRIILAMPSDGQKVQPFRIFKITRPIGGVVKIYAVHLSYDLSGIPVAPFTANDCSSALNGLKSNSMIANPFEVWTDISGSGKYKQNSPASFRSRLAGTDGSILDSFGKGAELEFDRLTVKVHQNRGRDNGVTIRYGKNLTDLKQQESIENVRTGVIAYWYKEENNTQDVIVGEIQYIENHTDYPKENIHVLDCSADFEKKPDKQQLNTCAKQYIKANNIGVPKVSIDVSFIQLWQTEEYKNIVSLERVSLCDTVHIAFEKLGVNAVAKVIKTEFDVLNEHYIKITLGEARSSFGEAIREATKSTIQPLVKSMVNIAVSNATANISGFSGYVTKITDANGNWSELVISDNADYAQARNVWRWSQGGLGFSSNGYAGPYTTAITADGHINGTMITAGTINANTINIGNKLLTETISDLTEESKGSIKGTKQYYLQRQAADKPSKTDSGWSTVKPSTIIGQHMWYMLADVVNNGTEIKHEPFELTGIKGDTGRGIVGSPKLTYQASTSSIVPPTGQWLENIPLVNEGYTLWTKITYTYSDKTTSDVYSPSIAGKTGRGVKYAEPQYYLSTSKTELVGGEWSNMQPEKTKDTWIWTRYKTIFTDDGIGYSEAVKADALNGWIDVSIANKSTIEQLNNSINLSVQETTAIKKSLQSTNDDLHALEAQTQQYATKAELQLTKDSISQTLTEEIDGKTAVLKQIKLQSDGMHIQGKEGSTTEQVLDEKSSKIVVNGKVMVDVNSTETRVQSLKAEGNFATGAHKFKRGTLKEISGETVACTNIYWIGGE
jgi:phage minor structural protein, N-terminal domain protein